MKASRITRHHKDWYTLHAGNGHVYVAGAASLARVKEMARLRGVAVPRDLKPTPPAGRPFKVGPDRYT